MIAIAEEGRGETSMELAVCDEDAQYERLLEKILETGHQRVDRTKIGTLSTFGEQMRFSLRGGRLPILGLGEGALTETVKKVLWHISGDTSNVLGNGEDLGPGLGFQWRHFGANYCGKDADYSNKGVDQLQNVIKTIRTDPADRRIILTSWNPIGK